MNLLALNKYILPAKLMLIFIKNNTKKYVFFSEYFYLVPEICLYSFSVQTTENDTKRGKVDFSESYPRIGAGIGLGYEYFISRNLSIDISVKSQFPNQLMKKDDDIITPASESIINSGKETKEASIIILSFNIGLLLAL